MVSAFFNHWFVKFFLACLAFTAMMAVLSLIVEWLEWGCTKLRPKKEAA